MQAPFLFDRKLQFGIMHDANLRNEVKKYEKNFTVFFEGDSIGIRSRFVPDRGICRFLV